MAPWLEGKTDVSVSEILEHCLGKQPGSWTKGDSMIVAKTLRHWKWEQYRVPGTGVRWYKHDDL
jgi:hypothetical protein